MLEMAERFLASKMALDLGLVIVILALLGALRFAVTLALQQMERREQQTAASNALLQEMTRVLDKILEKVSDLDLRRGRESRGE